MANSASNLVARVLSVDKANNQVTVHNKADLKSQAWYPPSSGNVAAPGQRILFNMEFGGNKNRYIQQIRLRGNMTALVDDYYFRGGIIHLIEEIRMKINDKNVYLVNSTTSPVGLAPIYLWDHYTNFAGLREFVQENECFNMEEKYLLDLTPSYISPAPHLNAQNTKINAGDVVPFSLPLDTFTHLFKYASCNHVDKISIEILLKKGDGVGSLKESFMATNPTGANSLNDIIRLTDLEMEVLYENYAPQGPFVQQLKSFSTSHDKYYEAREYALTTGSTLPVRINLNDDYTPMENIKRMILFTRGTATAKETTNGNLFGLGNSALDHWELRRNGVKILETKTILDWQIHIKKYYKLLHRHRTDFTWGLGKYSHPCQCFIDFSRGDIDLQNDGEKTYKTINGLKNFTSEYGNFELLIYPNTGGGSPGWVADTILTAVACSTRLFHVSPAPNRSVSEEL